MARPKAGADSLSGIFRKYFTDHPDWLAGSDNTAVYEQFKADYPSKSLNDSVKGVCANIKSKMRIKMGIAGRTKRGRKAGAQKAVNAAKSAKGSTASKKVLESLEESIDNCLGTAKAIEEGKLKDVVKYLRRARNFVSVELDKLEV